MYFKGLVAALEKDEKMQMPDATKSAPDITKNVRGSHRTLRNIQNVPLL